MFIRTCKLVSFFYHIASTARTFLFHRTPPAHEITFRIINASIVSSALACHFDDHVFSTFRTCDTNLFIIWLGIPSLRESRTCQELSMRSILDYHIAATHFTDFIRHFIFNGNLFEIFFRGLHSLFQIRIKIRNNRFPV